jgi:hypothetical protein
MRIGPFLMLVVLIASWLALRVVFLLLATVPPRNARVIGIRPTSRVRENYDCREWWVSGAWCHFLLLRPG